MPRGGVAWRGLLVIAGLLAALLVATSARYGYHRDELYFTLIGASPDWGYADQPALVPLLAHALDTLSGGSLVVLRLPSALLAGGTALITGLMAREFGATRGGQLFACACMAVGAFTLAVGHLLSTSTLDLFAWTLLSWLLVRALRDGGAAWLWAGLAAGIGLEAKTLLAFFLGAMLAGMLVAGPRDALRSWRPWVGAAIALALWLPNLAWQAAHGWPQLDLASGIAAGSSGTSASRWVFLPYLLVLISPFLVPVWAIGGWRLARLPELHRYRAFPTAFVILTVFFVATGGKPYYLVGLYPVLLAAGADPVVAWAAGRRGRRVLVGSALAASLAVAAYLFLPLLPVDRLAGSLPAAVDYDAGETVGWPRFGLTIGAGVLAALRDRAAPCGLPRWQLRGDGCGQPIRAARAAGLQRPQRPRRPGPAARIDDHGHRRRIPRVGSTSVVRRGQPGGQDRQRRRPRQRRAGANRVALPRAPRQLGGSVATHAVLGLNGCAGPSVRSAYLTAPAPRRPGDEGRLSWEQSQSSAQESWVRPCCPGSSARDDPPPTSSSPSDAPSGQRS